MKNLQILRLMLVEIDNSGYSNNTYFNFPKN